MAQGSRGASVCARTSYHSNWLLHLAYPAWKPSVSIVIPIYNRAWLAASLIKNCTAQTYPNIEIVIVDDGSTDGLLGSPEDITARVKIIRQEHAGVSEARNAGITAATGDFVHFLDSDNLLLPDCIGAKIRAFAEIPDAELCYCGPMELGLFGIAPGFGERQAYTLPHANKNTPSENLLDACLHGTPFLMSTVMMPRWVLLDVGPFDAELTRAEDTRYWFRVALRGTKAIAVQRRLLLRSYMRDGLNLHRRRTLTPTAVVAGRNLLDLLARPDCWHKAALFLALSPNYIWHYFISAADAMLDFERKRLYEAVTKLQKIRFEQGPSELPFLVILRGILESIRLASDRDNTGQHDPSGSLIGAVDRAMNAAAPVGRIDDSLWGGDLGTNTRVALDRKLAAAPPCHSQGRRAVAQVRALMKLPGPQQSVASQGQRRRPTFSLLVPVQDEMHATNFTLESCLKQECDRVEILLIGSDRARLNAWSERSPVIKPVFVPQADREIGFSLNAGVNAASAAFIRILSPGNTLECRSTLQQVRTLRNSEECTTALEIESDGIGGDNTEKVFPLAELLARGFEPRLSSFLLRRNLVREVGGFDSVLGYGYESRYQVRLAASGVSCLAVPVKDRQHVHVASFQPTPNQVLLGALANLADGMTTPPLWRCLPVFTRRLCCALPASIEMDDVTDRLVEYLFVTLRGIALGRRIGGLSPVPALALCLIGLEWARLEMKGGEEGALVEELRLNLLSAAGTAAADLNIDPVLDDVIADAAQQPPLRNAIKHAADRFRDHDAPVTPVLQHLRLLTQSR